ERSHPSAAVLDPAQERRVPAVVHGRVLAARPLEREPREALEARGGPQPGVLRVGPVPREGPSARAGDLLPPGVQPLVADPYAGEEPDPRSCRGREEESCEPGLLDDCRLVHDALLSIPKACVTGNGPPPAARPMS